MTIVGVLGGLDGDPSMWIVGACGAGMVGIGTWALLRYRRIALDNRYFKSSYSNEDA